MLELDWKTAGISLKQISSAAKKLEKMLAHLRKVVSEMDYYDDAASIILPLDGRQAGESEKLASLFKNTELIVVVGIGGSNLGARALHHAILSEHYNVAGKKALYADTTDPDSLHHIIDEIDRVAKNGNVLVNGISKSGSTTETIANFRVLYSKYKNNRNVKFVITTDHGSAMQAEAEKLGIPVLGIPNKIGGRYSVFSTVGLFPLAVLGVSARSITEGARKALDSCLDSDPRKNPALMIACLQYLHSRKGRKIHNHFVFSKDLDALSAWYRQLLAESIGKKQSSGIVPITSVGSTDLHSAGQEFIASDTVFHRFVVVEKHRHNVKVPKGSEFSKLVPDLSGKDYTQILEAILKGTQAAFAKRKRPFVTIKLPDKKPSTIGALMQMEMIEVILLAELLGVNAFDQPAVEEYKKITKKLLWRK